ncbi:MAG TPA: TetR/AcrR family transcriptional regulator [Bacteroidales bacterium]|nr:TetR/AcrR family transcriptional regulator [Bacteroidales bacterium]HPR59081.1 TetR/AcrR family transcriptional regulator [Bacteroidales bacterium]
MSIDRTKETIISTANRLFSRFGFHKTSMDEIAKNAHKAKGSLYYHFPSKEDLFREVITGEMNNLKNQLSIIFNNQELSAYEKFKNYLIKRMEILNNAANYHETLKADFFEHFHFVDDLRAELDLWEKNNIMKIVHQGINSGEFALDIEVDVATDVFLMVLKGLEIPFFLQNKYEEYSHYFDGLINILKKGITR